MKIKVVLLGQYRSAASVNEFLLEIPTGASAASVVARLKAESLQPVLPDSPVVAINYEQSSLETELREGDELALLPPVAGG